MNNQKWGAVCFIGEECDVYVREGELCNGGRGVIQRGLFSPVLLVGVC